MTIVVNPHSKEEEEAILAFLERMQFEYSREDDLILSDSQKDEILKRDLEYERGEAEVFSLNNIIGHFNIKEK